MGRRYKLMVWAGHQLGMSQWGAKGMARAARLFDIFKLFAESRL